MKLDKFSLLIAVIALIMAVINLVAIITRQG